MEKDWRVVLPPFCTSMLFHSNIPDVKYGARGQYTVVVSTTEDGREKFIGLYEEYWGSVDGSTTRTG